MDPQGSPGASQRASLDDLTPPPQVLDDLDAYLDDWGGAAPTNRSAFRWRAEVDADELEYVTNALYNLDIRLSAEVRRGERQAGPAAGLTFHLVLVGALLHALALESGPRAQFVEQLRSSWPTAAQAN
ncbi:MAG: hypothetical protein LC799_17835 [Actinobacteria bacterium]|nr:hypothetical protein [Actinomycetota bacterium]